MSRWRAPSTSHLDEALSKDWIEFWYQPKIDLRRKQLVPLHSDFDRLNRDSK